MKTKKSKLDPFDSYLGGYKMTDDLNEAARWYCDHEMTAAGGAEDED